MARLLVLLVLLYGFFGLPPALAQGGAVQVLGEDEHEHEGEDRPPPPSGGEEQPPGGDENPPPSGGDEHPPAGGDHPREAPEYDEHYAFYGEVRLAGERVVVGSRRLAGPDPLLAYLAPGMWVEAEGRVGSGGILVQRLRVLRPRLWAYYQGPGRAVGAGGRVRVWFQGEDAAPFRRQDLGPGHDPAAVIVACFASGRWWALPPALTPRFRASQPGWWRLTGAYYSDGLRIEASKRLGGCSP